MSSGVVPIDPLRDPRWDAFVLQHQAAGLFHSSAWIEVTQRAYGYIPAHLAYVSGDTVEGILPLVLVRSPFTGKRLVSLPYSGPAGPLGTSEDAVDALVRAAIESSAEQRCAYLHLQTSAPLPVRSSRALAESQRVVCSVIPLDGDPDHLWSHSLRKQMRYDIGRSRRLGVSIDVRSDRACIPTFYRLHIMTHRKHGIPPQPRRVFDLIWEVFSRGGGFWILIASVRGRPIQAMICLGFKDVLSAVYAGTDYDFRQYAAAKLVDWSCIEFALGRKFASVDLLQSDLDQQGLRWYKQGFGAVEVPVMSYYHPGAGAASALKDRLVRGQSTLGRATRTAVRHLPTPGLKFLGAATFKHMG